MMTGVVWLYVVDRIQVAAFTWSLCGRCSCILSSQHGFFVRRGSSDEHAVYDEIEDSDSSQGGDHGIVVSLA